MAENSDAEKSSSRLREIVRKRHALWWTGGAVVLIALAAVTWLEGKRIHFSLLHKWLPFPSDWSVTLGLGVAALLLALAILWKGPQWQVGHVKRLNGKERFDRVNEARKTLAQILGGIFLLAGLLATWQNLRVAQEALTVSQEGQITDRFTKGIEQLGAVDASGKKTLEVRLGGVYALERIANESKRDHWPIMEVLCTYVRENAPRKPQDSHGKNEASTPPPHPAADIQAILTVLGRRDRSYETDVQHLDLRKTEIHGASLFNADLGAADLSEADLSWAHLSRAHLSRANLSRANLTGADLIWALLTSADLSRANLRAADLIDADLRWAHLSGAGLRSAHLSEADLSAADLTSADLSRANLRAADLTRAHLTAASLSWADLSSSKGLTQEQVDVAIGDSDTQLPANLHKAIWWRN